MVIYLTIPSQAMFCEFFNKSYFSHTMFSAIIMREKKLSQIHTVIIVKQTVN